MLGYVERRVDVLAPDAGRQAVACVIGQGNRLGRRAEGHADDDRAENLFLRHYRRWLYIAQQRRRIIKPLTGQLAFALVAGCALADAQLDQFVDTLALTLGHNRPHVDGFVERIADAERLHAPFEPAFKVDGDALIDEQTGAGTTDLALVEPYGVDYPFNGGIEIGVGEDNERRFAAELERELFGTIGGGLTQDAADLG